LKVRCNLPQESYAGKNKFQGQEGEFSRQTPFVTPSNSAVEHSGEKLLTAEIAEKTIVTVGFSANSVKALRSLRLKAT
jgi:hypothetical protein